MDIGAIADASVALSLSETQQAAGTMVLKNALECERSEGASLIQCIQDSVVPSDHILDMLV